MHQELMVKSLYRKPFHPRSRLYKPPRRPYPVTRISYPNSEAMDIQVEVPVDLMISSEPMPEYRSKAYTDVNEISTVTVYGPFAVKHILSYLEQQGAKGRISINGQAPQNIGCLVSKGTCRSCQKPTFKSPQARYCGPCKEIARALASKRSKYKKKTRETVA